MERRIMQNLERSEFEEQWKDAFASAEVAPSASVWANVDRELTLADNTEGKRRIIFYQRLAAACVVFALVAGAFGVYHWKQSETSIGRLSQSKTTDLKPSTNSKQTESQNSTIGVDSLDETKINSEKTNEISAQPKSSVNDKKVMAERGAIAANSLQENKATALNSVKTSGTTPLKSQASKIADSQSQVASAANSMTKGETVVLNSEKKWEDSESKSPVLDRNSSAQNPAIIASSAIDRKTNTAADGSDTKASSEKTSGVLAENKSLSSEKTRLEINKVLISETMNDGSKTTDTQLAANVELPGLELLPTAEINGEPKLTEIHRKLPYMPASFMTERSASKFEHEKLWASVTAASGAYAESAGSSYNSTAAAKMYSFGMQQSTVPPLTGAYNSPPTGSVPTVGKSYSYGVIGGVRLAERWVLQTGVQYMNQTMNSSTSPYVNYSGGGLISTNEFVSVPVQAGYLLVNRKIAWQLNPGVSTDFFVRNTLSNQQQSMSQGAGDNSPYRSVNFAGLMSSEFSYKLGKNYRLSLVPGMRYSFNPALKSTTTGNAIAWDVGFRFRYIFK